MNVFLAWLWSATLAGSIAIVLTLALRPFLRRFLGAQSAFPAWAFSLALLVAPSLPKSPASVLPPVSELPPIVVRVVIPHHSMPRLEPAVASAAPRPFPWLITLWTAGAAVCAGMAGIRILRTRRLVKDSTDITPHLQEIIASVGGLPQRTRVCESQRLASPAMCGVFRPVILLPAGWAAGKDLRWILLHEVGHIRRGDLIWRWAFQIVCISHWFNPLVWIAQHFACIDQEMACDEWVLAQGDEEGRSDYGEAILRAARRPSGSWFMQAGMAESRSGLARRIQHLAETHPRGFWATALTLVLGLTLLLLLSPASPIPNQPMDGAAVPATRTPQTSVPPSPPVHDATISTGSPTRVEIEALFIEVDPKTAEEIFGAESSGGFSILSQSQLRDLLIRLQDRRNVDLMLAPKVTTKSGRQAIIRITREIPYPTEYTSSATRQVGTGTAKETLQIPPTPTAFEFRNVGVSLDAEPEILEDNRVLCKLTAEVVEFLGFVNYGAGEPKQTNPSDDPLESALRPAASKNSDVINQPVFRTREMQTTVVLKSAQTVMFGGLARRDKQAAEATEGSPAGFPPQLDEKAIERVLFVFVTTRLMDARARSVSAESAAFLPHVPVSTAWEKKDADPTPVSAPPAPEAPQSKDGIPYGTPVSGKPGFATSPWAPNAGYVDLRGVSPGTKVKCPYTGKTFLAP
jgi:beta-lactamase regulating signal transducer with metallopeptidase domain